MHDRAPQLRRAARRERPEGQLEGRVGLAQALVPFAQPGEWILDLGQTRERVALERDAVDGSQRAGQLVDQ